MKLSSFIKKNKGLLLFFIAFFSLSFFFNKQLSIPKRDVTVTSPKPNPKPAMKTELIGWMPFWDEEKAMEQLRSTIQYFTYFSPILYKIDSDGTLGDIYIRNREEMISLARKHDVPIIPVLSDESDYPRISRLLTSDTTQNEFIRELIETGKKEKFAGWSVDIEMIKYTDRTKFTNFVKNVTSALHKNDMVFHVIVYAKDHEAATDPSTSQDFEALGKIADKVILMVYGYHNDSTSPGGQAPPEWYRAVLAYAKKTIPLEKIGVGLSTHGYDWGGKTTVGLTYQQIEEIIKEKDVAVLYSKPSSSAVVNYEEGKVQHVIWYENATTITEKMNIAKNEFGITNFAIWRIGAADPKLFSNFENINK